MRKHLPIVLRGALDLVVPPSCWMCETPVGDRPVAFCVDCERSLTDDSNDLCPRCASTLPPFVAHAGYCPYCRDHDFAFDGVVRLGAYAGILREAILRMKQPAGEAFAEALAALAAPHLRRRLQGRVLAGVIPVPLHWWKRWLRGYNQSQISARALASAMKLPLLTRSLFRTKWTQPQPDAPDRRKNVRGCFASGRAERGHVPEGGTVVLVDDVLTSGATANEAARVLQTGLGLRTIVATLARASPPNHEGGQGSV
jgi:ComF family protein